MKVEEVEMGVMEEEEVMVGDQEVEDNEDDRGGRKGQW